RAKQPLCLGYDNQRVDLDNRIIATFDQYADEHQGLSDIGRDFIMDVTAGSSFVKSLPDVPDDIYDLVVSVEFLEDSSLSII
ncbi:hypothetical protein BGZ65_011191, partial [Modicella reniformis]